LPSYFFSTHIPVPSNIASANLLRSEGEGDISSRRSSDTSRLEVALGAHSSGGPDAALPSALGDIDSSTLYGRLQLEKRSSRATGRGSGGASTLGDLACNSAADGELGNVLIVEDDVSGRRVSGCVLEMEMRETHVLVSVQVVPVTAAGLIEVLARARSTSLWALGVTRGWARTETAAKRAMSENCILMFGGER
jgi:hypothetical protein